jgi:GST-like protein
MSITLYHWPTPNGFKVSIALEEMGLAYEVVPVDIGIGDQFKPDFLTISPNNKIPALTDTKGPDGAPISLFESGAILLYLAEKTGQFMPTGIRERLDALQWLMFQIGGVGPMLGQNQHFNQYAPETIPYAQDRYTREGQRLFGVVDQRLSDGRDYVCGDVSIVDFALFPWMRNWERQKVDLDPVPYVAAWLTRLAARPGVAQGLTLLAHQRSNNDAGNKSVLFDITSSKTGKG